MLLQALGRSQLTGIQRTVLNVKQVFSADARKAQDKILMLEHVTLITSTLLTVSQSVSVVQ